MNALPGSGAELVEEMAGGVSPDPASKAKVEEAPAELKGRRHGAVDRL